MESIINISSAAVTMGRPNYTHYTTSKSALIGMTRSMARELGRDGITVNGIMPGATFTEVPRQTGNAGTEIGDRQHAVYRATRGARRLAGDNSVFIVGC